MAFGNTTIKLVPKQFYDKDESYGFNTLLNHFEDQVMIEFDKCDLCREHFIGTEHNDPRENEIEMAIALCGRCC